MTEPRTEPAHKPYIVSTYEPRESTAWTRTDMDESSVFVLMAELITMGWTLHPYNQHYDERGFYEWILTEDPQIADLGRAVKVVKIR